MRGVVLLPLDQSGRAGGPVLSLIEPIVVGGRPVVVLELAEGRRWLRFQERYVLARGVALPFPGAAIQAGRASFRVTEMREGPDEGLIRRTVSLSSTQAAVVTVQVIPERLWWRDDSGRPTYVAPTIIYTAANHGQVPLEFQFPTNQFACFSVTTDNTGAVWEQAETVRSVVSRLRINLGSAFRKSITIPEEAAPVPGRYTVRAGLCGVPEYEVVSSFEVVR